MDGRGCSCDLRTTDVIPRRRYLERWCSNNNVAVVTLVWWCVNLYLQLDKYVRSAATFFLRERIGICRCADTLRLAWYLAGLWLECTVGHYVKVKQCGFVNHQEQCSYTHCEALEESSRSHSIGNGFDECGPSVEIKKRQLIFPKECKFNNKQMRLSDFFTQCLFDFIWSS
jgi:hypothetical protein